MEAVVDRMTNALNGMHQPDLEPFDFEGIDWSAEGAGLMNESDAFHIMDKLAPTLDQPEATDESQATNPPKKNAPRQNGHTRPRSLTQRM